ncbi:MAG: flagellar hook-length control protein FliK [bacterium]|nr:flagellar hook-length control protein FliK [bacterium]MCM1375643.1 flagellar hook-length control protein FliK [Muribaculum sp.]
MTSIPANVQNYLAASRTEQPKAQTAESKEDFGKVLDKQKAGAARDSGVKAPRQAGKAGDATQQSKDVAGKDDASVSGQPESDQTSVEETGLQQEDVPELSGVSDQPDIEGVVEELPAEALPEEWQGDLEEVMEVLQSAILQIQELLTQQLDITPEELRQLMQEKGITELQLLQPEVVNSLVLDAAGAEDPLSLVMDEGLYQSQQVINREFKEISQQLKQDLEETGKELPQVLEKLENSIAVQKSEAMTEHPQQNNTREHDGSGQERRQEQMPVGQVVYQNYTAQAQNQSAVQVSAIAVGRESAYVETQDSQHIMNQILDYMKVSMKPEDTVLEMHLHPESLGMLHVQISAREGVMTAHFTASSEAVKTVLENQMTVLKENFLQQDIKVDAIEVTVEAHQFENSLEQGRQRSEEEAGRRPKRRRLDIGSLESGEELTESEQIITEMMAANGNTVDYLA